MRAVTLLGKNAVKDLIVSQAVKQAFERVEDKGFVVQEYWLHSVAVAVSARLLSFPLNPAQWTPHQQKTFELFELSDAMIETLKHLNLVEKLPLSPVEDPFISGMMHDIGKVALVQSYPGLYPAVRAELVRNNWDVPMRFAEETIAGGADHTAVGALLAESWQLGDRIRAVIEHHHDPDPEDALISTVALADLVVGGFHPYPRDAAYPLVRLVAEDGAPTPPEDGTSGKANGEPATPEQEKLEPRDPQEALAAFLPPSLCERLGLSAEAVVELARVLAPSVGKRAEELRQSL
jgi:hypothetical protein